MRPSKTMEETHWQPALPNHGENNGGDPLAASPPKSWDVHMGCQSLIQNAGIQNKLAGNKLIALKKTFLKILNNWRPNSESQKKNGGYTGSGPG